MTEQPPRLSRESINVLYARLRRLAAAKTSAEMVDASYDLTEMIQKSGVTFDTLIVTDRHSDAAIRSECYLFRIRDGDWEAETLLEGGTE